MLVFPWPPSPLKPNVKTHWATKAKAVKEYKEACFYLTKEQNLPTKEYTELHLIFTPPSRRHYDLDNLLASMKAGLDGMSMALNIDDRCFTKITIEKTKEIGGMVKIVLG
jgi:crossover junction endodeoxyribonuclease RusA